MMTNKTWQKHVVKSFFRGINLTHGGFAPRLPPGLRPWTPLGDFRPLGPWPSPPPSKQNFHAPPMPSECLSVYLSVTRWYYVKTTQGRITKSSPTDSPRTLVLAIKTSSRNSKEFTPGDGVKWEGVGKIRNFLRISRRISEMMQVTNR